MASSYRTQLAEAIREAVPTSAFGRIAAGSDTLGRPRPVAARMGEGHGKARDLFFGNAGA